jgi:hypothetical protein
MNLLWCCLSSAKMYDALCYMVQEYILSESVDLFYLKTVST